MRDRYLAAFKQALIKLAPEDFITNVPLAGDLVEPHSHVVLITPIDSITCQNDSQNSGKPYTYNNQLCA